MSSTTSTKSDNINEPVSPAILTIAVYLKNSDIGSNIEDVLQSRIAFEVEGKCIKDGYVVPNSVKVLNYSVGKFEAEYIKYIVDYEASICLPFVGMRVKCVVYSVTLVGIHCHYIWEDSKVMDIFIARDDNYSHPDYNSIQEKYTELSALENESEKKPIVITCEIIGVVFELKDVSIITVAMLV